MLNKGMIFCRSTLHFLIIMGFVITSTLVVSAEPDMTSSDIPSAKRTNINAVATTDGLVAFWDFAYQQEGYWASYFDAKVIDRSFPVTLRRIGDTKSYSAETWTYDDENSKLKMVMEGPFGKAVLFNQGYIYANVARKDFDGGLLDLRGKMPFTMIAWCKFVGGTKRHMVAGIWDEGGWGKYAGRRQVALFGGLFGQKGVVAHISATGAASYPQSMLNGAKFARVRAIDGQPFENNQWVAMATSYDPVKQEISAYLNGDLTKIDYTDGVMRDVFQYKEKQAANPYPFQFPVYSPRAFVIKYNGYSLKGDGISEHRLSVNLNTATLLYEQQQALPKEQPFRLFFDVKRGQKSLLGGEMLVVVENLQRVAIPLSGKVEFGDVVWTKLEKKEADKWVPVGSEINRKIQEGAPFTFGRALGLGSEDLTHGSQIYIDGVAVFNRVLSGEELRRLSFGLGE